MSTLSGTQRKSQAEVMMKKVVWISVFVLFFVLFCCCRKPSGEDVSESDSKPEREKVAPLVRSMENVLDTAIMNFQKGEAAKGAELLLDGILIIKPATNWPDGFVKTISGAKEQLHKGDISGFKASLSHALSLLPPGRIEQEDEVGDRIKDDKPSERRSRPAPIASLFASLLASAKEKFRKGHENDGIREILKALQLIAPQVP